jgi:hypothetical protein
MSHRNRLARRSLGSVAVLAWLVTVAPAHAQEPAQPVTPQDKSIQAEPVPSTYLEPEPAPTEDTVTEQIPVTEVGPAAAPAEPIEPVHRPTGVWGPVAVAADVLVMRPLGLVSLVGGAATFVVVSPVAAATGTLGDRVDTLRDRVQNVFTRPLGAL